MDASRSSERVEADRAFDGLVSTGSTEASSPEYRGKLDMRAYRSTLQVQVCRIRGSRIGGFSGREGLFFRKLRFSFWEAWFFVDK